VNRKPDELMKKLSKLIEKFNLDNDLTKESAFYLNPICNEDKNDWGIYLVYSSNCRYKKPIL